jgi:cytochrome oxidase assembly protein ShyY1
VPITGQGGAPSDTLIRYRHVTVSGTYLPGREQYVANQTQGGRQGFSVLTPLRTSAAILMVVRGFVAATPDETRPAAVAPAPSGPVRVSGWLRPAQTERDQLGRLGHEEIMSVNAAAQAARLHTPVYHAYLTLTARQPGTAGLRLVPMPGLGNPAGGAAEWQLLSYVVQWYVFAALALVAPFLFARAEIRAARRRFLGLDPDGEDVETRAAALAPAAGGTGADLALRGAGTVARMADVDAGARRRAARLANRYGLTLGPDIDADRATVDAPPDHPRRRIGGVPDLPDRPSAAPAHTGAGLSRSPDPYHGSYNDYLWLLALADGEVPDVGLPGPTRPSGDPGEGRTIDGVVADPED